MIIPKSSFLTKRLSRPFVVIALSASTVLASVVVAVPANANPGDFIFTVDANSDVTITGYSGAVGIALDIPSTIEGNPVTQIATHAFYDKSLTSVTIPNSVTTIGEAAFYANRLSSVVIPNSVTAIHRQAFSGNFMTSVTIPNSVTTIGISAFAYNSLTSINIPTSLATISDYVFSFNRLTSVTIPNSVTTIGEGAFYGNVLTSARIPSSVTYIGREAFSENQLTSVVFAGNAPTAGAGVRGIFYNNENLCFLRIPRTATGWEPIFSDKPTLIAGKTCKPASAPTIRTARYFSDDFWSYVSLNIWIPRSNGGSEIKSYEYTVDNGQTWMPSMGMGNSLMVFGLQNGVNYALKIRAVTCIGFGATSKVFYIRPHARASAPTITSLTAASGTVKVEFDAPVNNGGAAITRYGYSLNGGPIINSGVRTSPFWIKGLKNGITNSVKVFALNKSGWGPGSEPVLVTPRK